jgi:alkanesulfonate monooxygenase SsuD/methylene tetrahydromethanopterin reductase-like flavin-dependent oxidoreductase (luciferase family)
MTCPAFGHRLAIAGGEGVLLAPVGLYRNLAIGAQQWSNVAKEAEVAQRLALGIIPGAGWRAADIRSVAEAAEAAGFEAIFAAEVNTDVLATAQLMGAATSTINVGSWVANIYLRHSYVCAKHAALIADATGGRMILGLGVSHQPVNKAVGIDMPSPLSALRQYTTEVAAWLRGEGPATHLPQQQAAYPVPLYLGALTSSTVELAGELADGVMPLLWSAERVARSAAWCARGRAKAAGRGKLEMALGLPIFIGDDMAVLMDTARANLGLFATLPFFQHLLRVSGFTEEAAKAEQGVGAASLSDRFLDAVCLIGPVARCRERLAAFTAAGVDLPILMPPVSVEGAHALINTFRL